MAKNNDETPTDLFSVHPTYGAATIRAGIFSGSYSVRYDEPAEEFGLQVHKDGSDLAISAGTTYSSDDDNELYTYHGLTIEDARALADALNEAAEAAEVSREKHKERQQERSESLIGRLLG